VQEFFYLVLTSFWLWATVRYPFERYASRIFDLTRPVHPLAVAVLPLVYLWPDWIKALAVAGVTGLLIAFTDRVFDTSVPTPVQLPRRRNVGGLPPLP
jgi:hypothetical protein